MRTFWVYILLCVDKTFYVGQSNDLERRMAQHGSRNGARYTKGRTPLRLVYIEKTQSRGDAVRRERALKTLSHQQKSLLVTQANGTYSDIIESINRQYLSTGWRRPLVVPRTTVGDIRKSSYSPRPIGILEVASTDMKTSKVVTKGVLQVQMPLSRFQIDPKKLEEHVAQKGYYTWKHYLADLIRSDMGLKPLGEKPKEKKEKTEEKPKAARKEPKKKDPPKEDKKDG